MQEQTIEQQQPSLVFHEETLKALLTSNLREQNPFLLASPEIQTLDHPLLTNDDANSESRPKSNSMLIFDLMNCEKLIEQRILAATCSLQQQSRDGQLEAITEQLPTFQTNLGNEQYWYQDKQNIFPGQNGEVVEPTLQKNCQTANQSNSNQVQYSKVIYLTRPHQNQNHLQPALWSDQQQGFNGIQGKMFENDERKLDAGECWIEVYQPQVGSLAVQNQMNLYQVQRINQVTEVHQLQMERPAPCPSEYQICIDIKHTVVQENPSNVEMVIQDEEMPDTIQLNETAEQLQIAEEIKEEVNKNQQVGEMEVDCNVEGGLPEMQFMQNQENNASLEVNITSESKCNLLEERKDLSFDMEAFQNVYQQLEEQPQNLHQSPLKNANQANQSGQNINIEAQTSQLNVSQQFMPVYEVQIQETNPQKYAQPVATGIFQEKQPVQATFEAKLPAPDLPFEKQLIKFGNYERVDSEYSEQTYLEKQEQTSNQEFNKLGIQPVRQLESESSTVYQDVDQHTPEFYLENEYQSHMNEPEAVVTIQDQPMRVEVEQQHELFIIKQSDELVESKWMAEPENVETNLQNQFEIGERNQAEIVQQKLLLSNNTLTAEKFEIGQIIPQNPIQVEKDSAPILKEQITLPQFPTRPPQKQLCSFIQQTEPQNTINQNLQKANIFITNNPDKQSKEVQVDNQISLNQKQESPLDCSIIPPCIKINISRDNQISLSIFNTYAANSYNQHHMNEECRQQENVRSGGQSKPVASADYLKKQVQATEKGTQATIDTKSVFTEMQQSQKLDFSQSEEIEQVSQEISQKQRIQRLHQITSMADNYLMFQVIEQPFHKKFEEMLKPHIALKMTPEPTTELGRQIFTNGLVLVAIVKMIARSSKSPFLQNYIFQYIESTFTIETNSYVFRLESNHAKQKYHQYLEQQYQEKYNQMRVKSEKEVKRASLDDYTQKRAVNYAQGKKLQLHSNSFSVNQQICGKNQTIEIKHYFNQETQTSARFQNTRAQNIKQQNVKKTQKAKQPTKLQEKLFDQPKKADATKPAPKNNNKSCLLAQPLLQVDSKKENKPVPGTCDINIVQQNQDKPSKMMESFTKPKIAEQKSISQKKSEFFSELQTSSQTKSPMFDQLYEKYKKIRENKKLISPKPLDEVNPPVLPVLKSVLIEPKQKQAAAEKKKRHIQFVDEIAELRMESEFSQEEEAKLKKRKKSRKSETSVEEQDETSKGKKNGSRK